MRPIDADALEDVVQRINDDCGCITRRDFKTIESVIFLFPTIDVSDRKVGEWKHDADGLVWCHECGFGKERSDERPYHYCPNCGAKMEMSEDPSHPFADDVMMGKRSEE